VWASASDTTRHTVPEEKKNLYRQEVTYQSEKKEMFKIAINPLTPELNPSAQRCLTKFFTGYFAS
jgi:hypothetical protein